jgi:hypothetical protein
MPTYLAYPKKADTPSRKSRKGSRTKIFVTNSRLAALSRRERRLARKEAEEAALEE